MGRRSRHDTGDAMSEEKNKLYFVYYEFQGAVCVGKVVGEHTVNGKPATYLAKFELEPDEFRFHWEILKRKYPYNG